MSLATNPGAGRTMAVPAALKLQFVVATGGSSRWMRWVSVAFDLSRLAAGELRLKVVPLVTMYSNAGPVIVEPSRLRATGKVMVVLKLALLVPAAKSQPLNTTV